MRYIEVWNEPNLSGFLIPEGEGPAARLDTYAAMDRAAFAAIRAANPDAKVIVGVGGPRSSTSRTGVGAIEWLRGLRDRDIPLDGYSQHVYPAAAPTVDTTVVPSWSSIGRVLDELDAWRSDPPIPLYITEAGYTTAATPYRDTAVTEAAAGRVPHPDLLAAPAAHGPDQGGGLVQPPGQRIVAGRAAARGPQPQAELRQLQRRW